MAAVNPGVYKDILRVRAAYPFDIACLLMRFYGSMLNIGVVTMITLSGYSFFAAGLVSSTIALSIFLVGPRVSKLIDRRGQTAVVPWAAAVSLAGLAVLIGVVLVHGPVWPFFIGAVLVGFYPSPQAMARTRWTYLIRSGRLGQHAPALRTMFSYESVMDDFGFIFSPSISIALAAAIHPVAGMMAGGVGFALGTIMLCAARSTAPQPGWVDPESEEDEAGALAEVEGAELDRAGRHREASLIRTSPVIRVLFVMYVFMGAFLGQLDTGTVSFAEDLHAPDIASFVLILQGVVSLVCGVVFGMVRLRQPLAKQLLVTASLAGLAFATMVFVNSVPSLVAMSLVGAVSYAPMLITSNTVCERAVPQRRLTEAITWMNAGFTCGAAVGPSLAGAVIDTLGTTACFVVGGVVALGLTVTALVTYPVVKRHLSQGYTVVEKRSL